MGVRKRAGLLRQMGIWLLAIVLAMPAQARAEGKSVGERSPEKAGIGQDGADRDDGRTESMETVVRKELYHGHIGDAKEGTGCYTKDVFHVHEGNPGTGGACYADPVYHRHTGNETEGGGCYGEKQYHIHAGNSTAGGDCYKEAVYHAHAGNAAAGGGCYSRPVYHVHAGNTAGGGCYGQPVYHSHTGNAGSGGGCYGRPVYHVHIGSESAGGGCYAVPVYHAHAGDAMSGGACYEPIRHEHTNSCYATRECRVEYSHGFQEVGTSDDECYHHSGTVTHMTFSGVFNHLQCGQGQATHTIKICWICKQMDFEHDYRALVCGKDTNTVEGYVLHCGKDESIIERWQLGCNQNENTVAGYERNCGKDLSTVESYQLNCGKNEGNVEAYQAACGKTENTVESYRQNCGKTEATVESYIRNCEKDESVIDAYALSCEKTEETVDGHLLGCGREEDKPYAVFSLLSTSGGWNDGPIVLEVQCEDRDNFLRLAEIPFSWEDGYEDADITEEGGRISQSRTVAENGVYTVHLMAENEDIDQQGLILSYEVRNIDRTAPIIKEIIYNTEADAEKVEICVIAEDVQPDGSSGSGLHKEAYSFDGGRSWSAENTLAVTQNGTVEIAVRDACGNAVRECVEVTNIRTDEGSGEGEGNGSGEGSGNGEGEGNGSGDGTGEGNGNGDGTGEGNGSGDGTGEGNGSGDGPGEGNGSGDGTGEGNGSGDGTGEGNGSGDGTGEGTGSGGETGNGAGTEDGNGSGGSGTGNDGFGNGGNDGGNGSGNSGAGNREESDGENADSQADPGNGSGMGENGSAGMLGGGAADGSINGSLLGKVPALGSGSRDRHKYHKKEETLANGSEDRESQEEESIGQESEEEGKSEKQGETEGQEKAERKEKTEEGAVKQKEVNAAAVAAVKPKTIWQKQAIAPVVKAVTYTVSSVAFSAVLLYLLYMMLRSIRVYHLDGEGDSHYAGSCIMKKTENGFEVKLPDMILEQSVTGQYILRPGRIFTARHRGEELLILTAQRRESVWVDREIPLKMATF